MIDRATSTVAMTRIAAAKLLRMCLKMIRWLFSPCARAATTKSCSRSLRVSMRATRAKIGQFDKPKAMMTFCIDAPSAMTSVMASRMNGNASMALTLKSTTESIQPPK